MISAFIVSVLDDYKIIIIFVTMKVNDIAYFCGYFSTAKSDFGKVLAADSFWTPCEHGQDKIEEWKGYYFPEFVDLCANKVKTYTHAYDQEIQATMRDGSVVKAVLTDLKMYLYPFGIVMYSIGLRQDDVLLADTFPLLLSLRMAVSVTGDSDFEKLAVAPLAKLCKAAGASRLMESGNKFKIFHIVAADTDPVGAKEADELLFSAGTMTMYDENDSRSFTRSYFDQVMSKGRLSVFKNWSALSLLDTFTILAFRPNPYAAGFWETDYFGKIYLYSLFRKFFLFRLNNSVRTEPARVSHLKDELEAFNGEYSFPMLSYNFLPELIVNAMETGLDIEDEKEKIGQIVTHEKERKEAETSERMNLFLGAISVLTLFSAIWDFACLMDGMFVFGDTIGTVTGFRACTMLIVGLICLIVLLTKRLKR
jgi:hypothetical protein